MFSALSQLPSQPSSCLTEPWQTWASLPLPSPQPLMYQPAAQHISVLWLLAIILYFMPGPLAFWRAVFVKGEV